jgi:ectoine hydroxylase-related dioxygenase (phytanoyl-CoA dioxygenase family)
MQSLSGRDELKARFDLDGFINYGRILNDEELRSLGERIDAICEGTIEVPEECVRRDKNWTPESGVPFRDAVWQVLNADRHDDLIRSLCGKAEIVETIELLLEGPATLWSTQFIMKPAHHGALVPWHQDSSYWGQEKRMTCWLAIDDATPFNGCMRMIPGSHRYGQLDFKPLNVAGVSSTLRETTGINTDTQVYVPVPAGCASFHHPLTLHASDANTTPHRRRAVAITYAKLER